ncbi:MAG: hypothetical protein ABIO70_17095 [Pseudomonadota bacterium]
MLPIWIAGIALAYESDQLTERSLPLEDASPLADARVDELLAQAVAVTNERTGCRADLEQTRRLLAREIHGAVGGVVRVPAQGQQPAMTFGAYAAWLATAPVERRSFGDRRDIYGEVPWWHNIILDAVGPAPTVRLGDTLVGIDKIDHFWMQGYLYFRQSHWGLEEEKAVRWGTHTEHAIWGLATTDIFSFADLAANFDGYAFYDALLRPGSLLGIDGRGCVVQRRPWRWNEHVDWQWDEVQNPSAYQPAVLASLRLWLLDHRDEVCAGLDEAAAVALSARVEEAILQAYPYVLGRVPARVDPFALHALCFGDAAPLEE